MKRLIAVCVFLSAVPLALAFAETVELDAHSVVLCVAEDDSVERLSCYDILHGRLSDPPPALPEVAPIAAPEDTDSLEVTNTYRAFFDSSTVTDKGVSVTVRDNRTGTPVLTNPATFMDDIQKRQTAKDSEAFRTGHDVFLAVSTLPELGEDGMMVVSCENNITHLRAIWTTPFDRSAIASRFVVGESLTDPAQSHDMVLRARSGGFELLGPRGLESIRMLREAVSGPRLQIAVGEASDDTRSLFFDMEPIRAALPLVARQCSWSLQTFRREF